MRDVSRRISAFLLGLLPVAMLGEVDTRAIVRRAVAAEADNWKIARTYGYLQRVNLRHLDSAGNPKSKDVKTYDVTLPEGSPYRRLALRDDRPLPAPEEKKERATLSKSVEKRRSESPAEHTERVAEYGRRPDWLREAWHELPDAFDFRMGADEVLQGRPMIVLDAAPRPGRPLNSRMAGILARIKGRLWIDRQTGYLAKADIEVTSAIWMGFFLLRVGPGSKASFEQVRVEDKLWLPMRVQARAYARLGLIKGLSFDQESHFSNYRELPEVALMVSRALAR